MQAHIVEHAAAAAVREAHTVQHDIAAHLGEGLSAGTVRHRRCGAEQLAQLGDGRAALLVGVVQLHQCLHGGEERSQEQQVGGQLSHCDPAAGGHGAADGQQHRLGSDADGFAARPVEGVGPRRSQVGVAVAVHHPAMLGDVGVPPIMGGDDPDAGQGLLEIAEQVADAVAHAAVVGRGPPPEPHRGRQCRRHGRGQGDEGQQRVVVEQQGGDHDQGEALDREVDDALVEQHRQRLDVGCHAGQQHPGPLGGVEVHLLALHVLERPDSQALHQPLAEPAGESRPDRTGGGGHRQKGHIGQSRRDQHAAVAGHDAVVHPDLGEHGAELQRDGLGGHQQEGHRQPVAVGPQEPPQPEPVAGLVGGAGPLHPGIGMGRLVGQHPLDPGPQVAGHLGVGQTGLGRGLDRGRSAAHPDGRVEHQSACRPGRAASSAAPQRPSGSAARSRRMRPLSEAVARAALERSEQERELQGLTETSSRWFALAQGRSAPPRRRERSATGAGGCRWPPPSRRR